MAHGSCNQNFLSEPKFSNQPGCGCTALGNIKLEINIKEDLAQLINYLGWTLQIIMLSKEILFCIVIT